MAQRFTIDEETTAPISVELSITATGAAVPLDMIRGLLLTLYDTVTAATDRVGSLIVPTQNVLSSATETVSIVTATNAAGNSVTRLEWEVLPKHTRIRNTAITVGGSESHGGYFELFWSEESFDTLTAPFATTDESTRVVVTDASHGLIVGNHIAFSGCENVGGLDLDGVYVIDEVIDGNSYAVTHRSAATSTATGGGSPTIYRLPKHQKWSFELSCRKVDIT